MPHVTIQNWRIIQKNQSHRSKYVLLSFQIPENWHTTLIGSVTSVLQLWFTITLSKISVYVWSYVKEERVTRRLHSEVYEKYGKIEHETLTQPQKISLTQICSKERYHPNSNNFNNRTIKQILDGGFRIFIKKKKINSVV